MAISTLMLPCLYSPSSRASQPPTNRSPHGRTPLFFCQFALPVYIAVAAKSVNYWRAIRREPTLSRCQKHFSDTLKAKHRLLDAILSCCWISWSFSNQPHVSQSFICIAWLAIWKICGSCHEGKSNKRVGYMSSLE